MTAPQAWRGQAKPNKYRALVWLTLGCLIGLGIDCAFTVWWLA